MKRRFQTIVLLIVVLSIATVGLAETATYGWQVTQKELHPHIQALRMASPLRGDRPPEKDVFNGEFRSWPQHKATLNKIYLVTLGENGTIKSSELLVKTLITVAAEDKNLVITHFKTDILAYKEGDVLVLVFTADGKTSLLSVRVSRLFIPH